MHWINERLAVSGLHDLELSEPVRAVLNVSESSRPYELPPGVAYLHRGFPDVQPFPLDVVWECVLWLDRRAREGRAALVHCAEGNSRSVSVVLAALMHQGVPLEEAKALVLARKPFVQLGGVATARPQYFQDAFLARWARFLAVRA